MALRQDPNYYVEVAGGGIYPIKTWCFFAEIVDDSLSQVRRATIKRQRLLDLWRRVCAVAAVRARMCVCVCICVCVCLCVCVCV
jgi:hypothetical protein